MRALIQRVRKAEVEVDGQTLGQIGQGLLVLVGFLADDNPQILTKMLNKILHLRIFQDAGKMDASLLKIEGGLLIVPQFTLAANLKKGRRPSFSSAAPAEQAKLLFETFSELASELAKNKCKQVAFGRFGADMQVHLTNDGPVTFWLDSEQLTS